MPQANVDALRLSRALRSLGIFYGAEGALADVVARAASEAEAVRTFIERERPHLLKCYELEALVAMVLAACDESRQPPASIEAYRA